ncbi:MAG: CoA-binding protein [Candidatus Lernaella stagnicola]|nr:CoA-binding protein [Candidatus Lernaella stagnicola]
MTRETTSGAFDLEISPGLFEQMDQLCYPRSVAIMGASQSFIKWGSLLTANLLKGGFEGQVYPIHNSAERILDRPAYKHIQDCPGPVDLAFITLPREKAVDAMRECAVSGVKNVVVVTSGFSETGAEGAALEKELVGIAREAGIRLLGPNTMGMISTRQKLCMTGSVSTPPSGGISMISQSGNLGAQVMLWAQEQGVGVNKFFGSGNEADLTATELLAYLGHDESTTAVLVYLEGIEDGQLFLRVAHEVASRKPIVVLKSGRTDDGARAASSHTGALSGSYDIWRGAMRQAGVVLVKQPMDLIDGAAGMENLPMPHGNRVCVITLGGGWGVVATDLCNEYGLDLPPLPDEIRSVMDKKLPPFWSRSNPIDLVGKVDPDVYVTALEQACASDAFDAVITLGLIGSSSFAYEIAEVTADVAPGVVDDEIKQRFAGIRDAFEMTLRDEIAWLTTKYGKPVVNVSLDKRHNRVILDDTRGNHIVAYNTPEKAVRVLAGMTYYQRWRSLQQRS